MNIWLKLFRVFIWIGIVINMVFAIPALVAPGLLNTILGLPLQAEYPWLENAGMLLVGVSLFYAPAGINPLLAPLYAWLCAISRLIAVVFWIYLVGHTEYPSAFTGMLYGDGAMFIILSILLTLGLPAEDRLPAMIKRGLQGLGATLKRWFSRKSFRAGLAVAVVVVLFLGYATWQNMIREVPQPDFKSDVDHFKYAAIGLGLESRIPYYLFAVLPDVFPEKLPSPNGWKAFGLTFEGDRDIPIGLAKRHVGYPTVEPNCSLCHTSRYQKTADDVPVPVPTGPANQMDLEAFQWFLYDCAADPKFNSKTLLKAIHQKFDLGFVESLFYRFVILPLAKMSLQQQQAKYAWQKLRPPQGPGRTDTFNPTKIVVFGFPDDSTIGTVDLPQIWNQKPREGLYLHWDGNNNSIKERNYAAAMAVGATPHSVLPASFKRVTDWLLTVQPPDFPFPIDQEKANMGQQIWERECANCHQFGKVHTGQVTVEIDELGTDPHRLGSFTVGLVDKFHEFKKPPFDFGAYRKTHSYSNTPTDGIWLRGPYLHNGSVPSLWDLLQPPEKRPTVFYRGYEVIDPTKVGFISMGPEAEKAGSKFDTRVQGNHNSGHTYGTELPEEEKWALIEYMKTL